MLKVFILLQNITWRKIYQADTIVQNFQPKEVFSVLIFHFNNTIWKVNNLNAHSKFKLGVIIFYIKK